MIAVVVDTNVIHRDPWLTGGPGQELLRLAAEGKCVVVYPQVVIEELSRQRVERARLAHTSAADGLAEIGGAGVDVAETEIALASVLQRIESDIDSAFADLMNRPGVVAAPVPQVAAEDLLRRDLDRRRPFLEIDHGKDKKRSTGFRDVLIWETVLELARSDSQYESILFVTADNGFIDAESRTLHPELVEDLTSSHLRADLVDRVDSIPLASAKVESTAAMTAKQANLDSPSVAPEEALAIAVDELRGPLPGKLELVTAATTALYALENEEVSLQMVYGGDYDYPEFMKFTMPAMESGMIVAIDQTSDFTFEESPLSADILVATANAILTIEGAVYKGDWFGGDADEVQVMGELNDHYFESTSEVAVRAVVELDIEGGGVTVSRIVLEDDRPQADSENQISFDFPAVPENSSDG